MFNSSAYISSGCQLWNQYCNTTDCLTVSLLTVAMPPQSGQGCAFIAPHWWGSRRSVSTRLLRSLNGRPLDSANREVAMSWVLFVCVKRANDLIVFKAECRAYYTSLVSLPDPLLKVLKDEQTATFFWLKWDTWKSYKAKKTIKHHLSYETETIISAPPDSTLHIFKLLHAFTMIKL